MTKKAYMAFAAEAPMIGLDPHPGYAPAEEIKSFDAAGYMEALGADEDRAKVEALVDDHHASILDAVERGDMEDADDKDDIHAVEISDDGQVKVFHEAPYYLIATYTMSDIYEAFGMEMPAQPAG